jgi:pilus assembly protein CpaE
MDSRNGKIESPLAALMISPNRELAERFNVACVQAHSFQVLADMKSYPPLQTLDIRLRQLKPDVVLLDLATDFNGAADVIRAVAGFQPPVHVIGLHTSNDPEAILNSLRLGATEFLSAPFEAGVVSDAIARIRRLRRPEETVEPELGQVISFSSSKPGSGASTLAMQIAFSLKRLTGKRTLLIDCDLLGGTIGFCLKLNHSYSMVDALERADRIDDELWSSMTVNHEGLDILPAPEVPRSQPVDQIRLHEVLTFARLHYDWVILDLPTIFHQLSLTGLAESDQTYIVTTTELPSLHLTRKAVNLLTHLGIGKDRFRVVLNRASKREGIGGGDIEKIFACPVHAKLPNDYFSLHRVVTLGQPLTADCELGKAIEGLAGKLFKSQQSDKRVSGGFMQPALSQS